MAILERHVQELVSAQESAYQEWEKIWVQVEKRLGGFPQKRYYSLISGSENIGTIVWEREWSGFAAMETAYDKLFADPEIKKLNAQPGPVAGERMEFYMQFM